MISPLYGQLSPLRIPTKARRQPVTDSDAETYLQAVEAADGQQLEQLVANAINTFVAGCKTDGIWSAIKSSCILAGARSLSGAIVPLAGTAPTNFNFVTGDYNRKTGLKSDGTTKSLRSNRLNNADPQNSKHISVYVTETDGTNNRNYVGGSATTTGTSQFFISNSTSLNIKLNGQSGPTLAVNYAGFIGANRSNATGIVTRGNNQTFNSTFASQNPSSEALYIFANATNQNRTTGRISFYSIGESLDLVLLNTRLATLMSTLNSLSI